MSHFPLVATSPSPHSRHGLSFPGFPETDRAEREVPHPGSAGQLRFRVLHTEDDIADIMHLRSEIQLPASVVADPAFSTTEQRRDYFGWVGAFELDGTAIGTIRLVPLGLGLAPCEPVVHGQPELAGCLQNAWEVGRLVLAPAYRTNADILKRCFCLTLLRFMEDHARANFFATGNPVLCRLYRRFGFSVVAKDAVLTANDRYSLIHGTVETVRQAVAREADTMDMTAPTWAQRADTRPELTQ